MGVDGDDISGEREGGLRLWEAKYQFQQDMLPMFVGETFGRKVNSCPIRSIKLIGLLRSFPRAKVSTLFGTAAMTVTGSLPGKKLVTQAEVCPYLLCPIP